MPARHSYGPYVKQMRGLIAAGENLATEARFVDMISQQHSKILDIGCGHGSAVTTRRQSGHKAYGSTRRTLLSNLPSTCRTRTGFADSE